MFLHGSWGIIPRAENGKLLGEDIVLAHLRKMDPIDGGIARREPPRKPHCEFKRVRTVLFYKIEENSENDLNRKRHDDPVM